MSEDRKTCCICGAEIDTGLDLGGDMICGEKMCCFKWCLMNGAEVYQAADAE